MQFLLVSLSPSNSLLLGMRWTTTPRGPSGSSGALYLRRGWAASSSCHSCESGESGVGCVAASGQLHLLGSPVAAGAGWGLGNDPALRTWGPLLVQVASLSRPSPFPYHFPVVSWRFGSRFPWSRGSGGRSCAEALGLGLGPGRVCGEAGETACPAPPRPASLGMRVHSQVLVKLYGEFELGCPLFESTERPVASSCEALSCQRGRPPPGVCVAWPGI